MTRLMKMIMIMTLRRKIKEDIIDDEDYKEKDEEDKDDDDDDKVVRLTSMNEKHS